MTLLPRSLLWRTVLLLAVLMVAGHFASLEIFRAAEREPRAVQIAQQIASVVNLTRTMAIELGSQGILTNCIAPGSILTDGTKQLFYGEDGQFSDRVKGLLAHIPLGRPGQPEEIAHAVLFLAAPESSYLNGAIIPVDGGWLAGYSRDF